MPRFLTAPLERVDPVAGGVQLVVVTADAEAAVALAEAVLRLTGLGGIELFPVTTARRAARLMQGRPILAIAGAPADLADLIRGSQLKMDAVRTVVLAWVDDVLDAEPEATNALELLMTEVPKDSARIVVTERPDARLDAFIERYLRRARRIDERETIDESAPVALQYVTASPASRAGALRRLLDELDPPSATVVASEIDHAAVANLLRALGYTSAGAVRHSTGEVAPGTHAVIFFGLPATRAQLVAAAGANPVTLVAMVQPRELPALRRMSGGEVKPLTLPEPGKTARDRERALRRELTGVLDSGVPAREILALEPLLDKHDGIEIAAAALRLLERERAARKNSEDSARASGPKREPAPAPGAFPRGPRPPEGARGTAGRGGRPGDSRRGPPDRGGRPSDSRRGAPDRGGRSSDGRGAPDRGGRSGDGRHGPPERGARPFDPGRGPPGSGRPPRGRS
ncbi:MAG TPA: DEAD/DEAH box helicase [Gemmatimonadaceae bacterium]|nr:DEAD/DEAH box helicase [Gemmatimonadaceae bacterium]